MTIIWEVVTWNKKLSSGSLKVICHKGIVTLVEEEKEKKGT